MLTLGVLASICVALITDYHVDDAAARGSMMVRKARRKKDMFKGKSISSTQLVSTQTRITDSTQVAASTTPFTPSPPPPPAAQTSIASMDLAIKMKTFVSMHHVDVWM
jgi:hypothetical protein